MLIVLFWKKTVLLATEVLKFIADLVFFVENFLVKREGFESLKINSYNWGSNVRFPVLCQLTS